ncbi:MAG: hypothetical protein M3R02_03805 [Chloroflexota bacterium]|nr:hypothetical protein [Chloroflexota bacterium]
MPGETPARRKRRTWRDWLPPGTPEPDTLLTRSELLDRLHADGIDVSTHDLDNWQTAGIIPYGVRRRHEGATRTLYPEWMADQICYLRELQDEELPLPEISAILKVHARASARGDAATQDNTTTASASAPPGSFHAISANDALNVDIKETASVVKTIAQTAAIAAAPNDIIPGLLEWAREHERTFGTKITRVDVSLVDEYGHPLTFRFDT